MDKCFYCQSTDQETRPYGPGGSSICFPCAVATPERQHFTEQQFKQQMNTASQHSSVVVIGEETGPRPIFHNKFLQ